MQRINKQSNPLIEDSKTIDWLVNNTEVSVFNPVTFTGYQRKIDRKHCEKIVEYLEKNIFLPVAIICACDGEYNEEIKLRIVDGQHRVEAFKIIKESNPQRYAVIKDAEMPIIILEKVNEDVEVETFIKINKTSKKVDTSLAYLLRNRKLRQNKLVKEGELEGSQAEYLSVMTAISLNETTSSSWFDKIIYEGGPRNYPDKYISVNSFVGATKPLVNTLIRKRIINTNWNSVEDAEQSVEWLTKLINDIWNDIHQKWHELESFDDLKVLHSAIGYTAINKFLYHIINNSYTGNEDIRELFKSGINAITVDYSKWQSGNEYSKFSSSAGHGIIAKELIESIGKNK